MRSDCPEDGLVCDKKKYLVHIHGKGRAWLVVQLFHQDMRALQKRTAAERGRSPDSIWGHSERGKKIERSTYFNGQSKFPPSKLSPLVMKVIEEKKKSLQLLLF